jgi:hypothetical protein
MEIVRGFQKKQSTRRLQAFLNAVTLEEIIPFGQPAADPVLVAFRPVASPDAPRLPAHRDRVTPARPGQMGLF